MSTIRTAALMMMAIFFVAPNGDTNTAFWAQWGANPQHTGMVDVKGQVLNEIKANIVYDPFVNQEKAENVPIFGEAVLSVHEQAPITDGDDVYMETKTGKYISCHPAGAWFFTTDPCGPNTWNLMIWNEAKFSWKGGTFQKIWSFQSDWKPEPSGEGLIGWEPVFHPVDANGFIYVPGAGGTLWKVDKQTGSSVAWINPLSHVSIEAANTYVSGPLSADAHGNIYYNVIELSDPSLGDPWFANDVQGAWLVKVTPENATSVVTYESLVPDAPEGFEQACPGVFSELDPGDGSTVPWPPAGYAGTFNLPPQALCGSQRPPLNVAPAIDEDGTVYTVSRAHFNEYQSYLIAVNPSLTAKWSTSLQFRLDDGCGVILPIAPVGVTTEPFSCRNGTTPGVDPQTNAPGSALISDLSTASPVVAPDGSILYGVVDNYNFSQGHMFKFDSKGNFLGSYPFGWDDTPGVYKHGETYSIITKDNRYGGGAYCFYSNNPVCAQAPPGPYYITQLDSKLKVEWQFKNTNTESCHRKPDGSVSCINNMPASFEWCINMPAVDADGNVYVNSEDGNLYMLPQGHTGVFTEPGAKLFLDLALGAAYTPLSIGPDGTIYTQNNGHFFVIGN